MPNYAPTHSEVSSSILGVERFRIRLLEPSLCSTQKTTSSSSTPQAPTAVAKLTLEALTGTGPFSSGKLIYSTAPKCQSRRLSIRRGSPLVNLDPEGVKVSRPPTAGQ